MYGLIQAVNRLLSLLQHLAGPGTGTAIAVVMHNLNLAAARAGRVVLMRDGRFVADGPPDNVLRDDLLESAYSCMMTVVRRPIDGRTFVLPHDTVTPSPALSRAGPSATLAPYDRKHMHPTDVWCAMRLNKSTNDAILILMECARCESSLVKAADLSARLDITPQNIFKIGHILSRAGLVAALRWRYGEMKLARPAAQILIGEVERAMETMGAAAVCGQRG